MHNGPHGLALLSTSYPLSGNSTSGIFVARLAESLANDFPVHVVTPAATEGTPPVSRKNIIVAPFRYAPRKWQRLAHAPGGIPVALQQHRWLYLLLPFFLLAMLLGIARYGFRCGIAHANWAICGAIAGIAGKICGFPVLTTLRGEDVTRAKKSRIDRAILSLCVSSSDHVIGVSQAIVNQLMATYPQATGKIAMIPNGVDDELLAIHRADRPAGPHTAVRLLTIGSLIPRKGMDIIIRALSIVDQTQPCHLTIAGDGPEADHLKTLARLAGLEDRITFLGSVPPTGVAKLLADADVFILASHSEGRPNVVLEAMAAELPVIASDIDGTRELVAHDRTGLLFQDGAAEQLAKHIAILASDTLSRQEMGRNARKYILDQGLRWSDTAEQYGELYKKMLAADEKCAA